MVTSQALGMQKRFSLEETISPFEQRLKVIEHSDKKYNLKSPVSYPKKRHYSVKEKLEEYYKSSSQYVFRDYIPSDLNGSTINALDTFSALSFELQGLYLALQGIGKNSENKSQKLWKNRFPVIQNAMKTISDRLEKMLNQELITKEGAQDIAKKVSDMIEIGVIKNKYLNSNYKSNNEFKETSRLGQNFSEYCSFYDSIVKSPQRQEIIKGIENIVDNLHESATKAMPEKEPEPLFRKIFKKLYNVKDSVIKWISRPKQKRFYPDLDAYPLEDFQ